MLISMAIRAMGKRHRGTDPGAASERGPALECYSGTRRHARVGITAANGMILRSSIVTRDTGISPQQQQELKKNEQEEAKAELCLTLAQPARAETRAQVRLG